jgi:hypothetical protein
VLAAMSFELHAAVETALSGSPMEQEREEKKKSRSHFISRSHVSPSFRPRLGTIARHSIAAKVRCSARFRARMSLLSPTFTFSQFRFLIIFSALARAQHSQTCRPKMSLKSTPSPPSSTTTPRPSRRSTHPIKSSRLCVSSMVAQGCVARNVA